MAQHKSAEKRIRQTEVRTARNRAGMSRLRTFVKQAETAIAGSDSATAVSALSVMQSELHRGVQKGLLHKNAAARKIARLTARFHKAQSK